MTIEEQFEMFVKEVEEIEATELTCDEYDLLQAAFYAGVEAGVSSHSEL